MGDQSCGGVGGMGQGTAGLEAPAAEVGGVRGQERLVVVNGWGCGSHSRAVQIKHGGQAAPAMRDVHQTARGSWYAVRCGAGV